jgi:hypothetical protein
MERGGRSLARVSGERIEVRRSDWPLASSSPKPNLLPHAGRETLGEPSRRVGIVLINHRPCLGERSDGGERRRRLPLVVADAVDRAAQHRRLAVQGIAGDEEGHVWVLDDHREMVARVPGVATATIAPSALRRLDRSNGARGPSPRTNGLG